MNTLVKIETVDDLQNHWRDPYAQWWAAGMPSFDQPAKDPFKQIVFKFRTKEDRQHFADRINFKLTDKTNVIWYPIKDRDPNSTSRYVEQGYDQDRIDDVGEDDDE